jgi:ATP-dependent RNA helicase DDX3X
LIDRGKIDLSNLRYLVLDEADRMLDMGFESSIREIAERKGMAKNRVTLMYSATFPKEIRALARDFLKPNYLFLKVGRIGGTTTDITQNVIWVEENEKRTKLKELLLSQPPCRTLIFVDTKRNADTLDQYLYENNLPSTSIHGDRSQMEREDALLAFKAGKCPILVATAVVARGIDVRNVMHVVNYDMTPNIDEYIHRIGRTARVGNAGLATSFFNHNSSPVARDLTKLLIECKQKVPDFLERYRTKDM